MNMREKRKRLLDEAKKMAEMAGARPGGEFTADELVRIDAIKSEVDELTEKIKKVDEAQEIIRKMAGEPPVFGRAEGVKLDPLADAFTEAYGPDGTKSALSPAGATMVPVSIGAVIEARTQPTLGGLITQKELPGSDRFTYLRQTVRTNNAAHVPIGDEKPTSVYTLDRVTGQAVTVAHLSEPIPRQ